MRTNKFSQLITVVLLFLVMSCVAANGKYRKLSRAEIQAVLKEIGSQPNAAIHQQANDGSISLFALGGHRKTDFGGCLADEYVVELSPSSEGWRVDSHDKFLKLSLAPCGAKKDSDFFEVDGQYSSKMIKKALHDFFLLRNNKIRNELISFSSSSLPPIMQRANFDRIVFISIVNETEVRFQFDDDELFPRRLGINLVYSDGLLSRVAVDDHYSVEETQK